MMISDSYNTSVSDLDVITALTELEIKRLNYPKWAHQIRGYFLFLLGIVGLFFNTCVLYTFAKNKQLRSPTNMFVIGLAISDLCMAVFGIPLASSASINGYWFAGDAFCTMEAFVVYAFGLTALYLLTSISLDRYIVIAKPLKAQLITKRVAICSVLACFGGGFFWALLPFTGWSSYGLEAPGVSCGLHYEDQSMATITYLVAIFIFVFMLPLCLMIFCYFNVYQTVRSISRNTVWDSKSKLAKKNLKIEKKMLKSCIIMCSVFWACWFPYAVATFWAAFGDPDSVPLVVTAIPAAAAKTEVVWNPIIYVATNKQFRRAFYGILPCTGLRDMLVKREEKVEQESKESDVESNEGAAPPAKEQPKAADDTPANPNAVNPETNGMTKVDC